MSEINLKQLVDNKIGRYRLIRPVNIYPYNERIKKLANESHIAIGLKYNGESVNLICVDNKIVGYTSLVASKYLCEDRKIDFSRMIIYQAEMLGDTFFIYDLLYINGKVTVNNSVTYKERFALITEVPIICGKYRAQRRFLIFDKFSQKLIDKFLILLNNTKIPNDGAIIYCGITCIRYTDLEIYKYKPRHELTVDLLLKDNEVFAYGGQSTYIKLTGFGIIDDKKIAINGACNEFRFSDDCKSLIVTRPRPDRNAPNMKFVIESTYAEFKNYVEMKDIINKLGLKIKDADDDGYDEKLDDFSYSLKKKFNFFVSETHKIKDTILSTQTGVILDCGFGQGADYSKYKGAIKKFYAVEPNMDNIYRGITERKDFKSLMDIDIKSNKLELIFEFAQCITPIRERCDYINFMFSFTYFFKTKEYFNAIMDVIRGSSKVGTIINILTFDGEKYYKLKNSAYMSITCLSKDCSTPGFGKAFHTDLVFSKTAKNIHEYGVYKSIMLDEFARNGFTLVDFKEAKDFHFKVIVPEVRAYAETVVKYTFKSSIIPSIDEYKSVLSEVASALFNVKFAGIDDTKLDVISACKQIKSKFIGHKLGEYKLDWRNVVITSETDTKKAELIAIFITESIVTITTKPSATPRFSICGVNFV